MSLRLTQGDENYVFDCASLQYAIGEGFSLCVRTSNSELSPEGTVESSPGRESWVGFESMSQSLRSLCRSQRGEIRLNAFAIQSSICGIQ